MAQLTKFTIPELKAPNSEEFRAWETQIMAHISSIPEFRPLFDVGFAANPHLEPVWPTNAAGIINAEGLRMRASYGVLYAACFSALQEDTLREVTQAGVGNLMDMLTALRGAYLMNQNIDQSTNLSEFYEKAYIDKDWPSVREWIARKWSLLLMSPDLVPVAGRCAAMRHVMSTRAGHKFSEVCNRLRITPGQGWMVYRDALVDYEKSELLSGRGKKQEVEAFVGKLESKIDKLTGTVAKQAAMISSISTSVPMQVSGENEVDSALYGGKGGKHNGKNQEWEPSGGKGSWKTSGFRGRCNKCGTYGHTAKWCRKKVKKDDKGGKKAKGKKGKKY